MGPVDVYVAQEAVDIIAERHARFGIVRTAHDRFLVGQQVVKNSRRDGKTPQIGQYFTVEIVDPFQNMEDGVFMVVPYDIAAGGKFQAGVVDPPGLLLGVVADIGKQLCRK